MEEDEGRRQDYEEIAFITNQHEGILMDDDRPPTSDEEDDEVQLLGGASPLEAQWISHTLYILTTRLVENLMWIEQLHGVYHLAAYLVRREIRTVTLERRDIAAAYMEYNGRASYNVMRCTCSVV
jgi:hypothetical protein